MAANSDYLDKSRAFALAWVAVCKYTSNDYHFKSNIVNNQMHLVSFTLNLNGG